MSIENLRKIKVSFYSVLPSPYQRDILYTLSQHPEIDLQVFYLEGACSDSPWPEKPLQPYEYILPGFHLTWGLSRFHLNWHWPKVNQSDVVVLNGYMSLTAQLLLRLPAKKIPCIFWGEKMVGNSTGIKGKLQEVFANSLKNCRAIAAIGEAAVQDYKLRYPDKLVVPIPYYCDLEAFQKDIPLRPREPITILFCGQMIERKGVDLLLTAFSRLIESGLTAKLVLVGREAELPQMMANLPESVKKWVNYAGFQAPEALPQFFRQADIFVLPSRYDGWGVVMNQAIGAGLPIICSDAVGSAPDLVTMGENGFIFPAGDGDKLYEALHYYVSEPARITVASAASQRRSPEWSPEAGAKRWVELCHQVLL